MPTVILRRRRRWVRLVVVAVVVVALAIVWMTRPRGAAGNGGSSVTPTTAVVGVGCQLEEHSVEGAVKTAAEGLHALAVANLGAPDSTPEHAAEVERTIERWVVPEQRPGVRSYLQRYPMALVSITSRVDGWEPLSFTPAEAGVRLAVTDVGTTAIGTTRTASAVFDVELRWDGLQSMWRLASWARVNGPNLAAELAADGKELPCA